MESQFDRQDGSRQSARKLKVPVPGEPVDPRAQVAEINGPILEPRPPKPPARPEPQDPPAESDGRLREARAAAAAGPMSPSSILMAVAGTSGAPQTRQRPGTRATAYDPGHPVAGSKSTSGFADSPPAAAKAAPKLRPTDPPERETPPAVSRPGLPRATSTDGHRVEDDDDDDHFELRPRAEPAARREVEPATGPTCPECHQELVRIVCGGAPLRVCVECKGFWFPVEVIKDLAESHDMFRQLAAAADMLSDAGLR